MTNTMTITLDVNNLSRTEHDEDGDAYTIPFEEMVLEQASKLVFNEIRKEAKDAVRDKIRAIADEEIRKVVAPAVEEAVNGTAYYATDRYGYRQTNNPKPLHQHIIDEALTYLKQSNGSRGGNQTDLQKHIDKQVKDVVTKELQATLDEARDAVRAKLAAEGGKLLADAIQNAAASK